MKRHQLLCALCLMCIQTYFTCTSEKNIVQEANRDILFSNSTLAFKLDKSDNPDNLVVNKFHSLKRKLRDESKRIFQLINYNTKSSSRSKARDEILSERNFVRKNEDLELNVIESRDTFPDPQIPEIDGTISKPKIRSPALLRQACPVTVTVFSSTTEYITTTETTTVTATVTVQSNQQLATLTLIAIIATAVAVPISIVALTTESEPFVDPPFPVPNSLTFLLTQQTSVNTLDIPVQGESFPPDGCRINAASFNGTCYPLLTRGPCGDPRFWLTLDPNTLRSRCTPRLCGRNRVFVERDGLCHDIYDPSECSGGRRLFYSAFGDPVCDCPLGKYPFPTPQDDCVSLFQQGPCPQGNVVNFVEDGRLECTPSQCPASPSTSNPLLPAGEDGICYGLGTTGPCRPDTQLLGYDVFELRAQCVGLTDPQSPYFSSPEEDELLDSVYNQRSGEFDDFRLSFVQSNRIGRNDTVERRQGFNTFGAFQVSSGLPNALLNPCRPGSQNSYNTKCSNPILPEGNRAPSQAVRPAFGCPGQSILQATGQCRRPLSF